VITISHSPILPARNPIGARECRMAQRSEALLAAGLSTLLGVAAFTHFVAPTFYDGIVPHALPGSRRSWTLVSGAAELACAAAVATPRTRRLGGGLAAALFVAVFPANIQMALDWRHDAMPRPALAFLRLPLQLPLIWWAWRVRRAAASQ
jgi:uncharacterized membrane protein